MKRPGWILVAVAVALTASALFLRSATSHAAASVGNQDNDALTAARFELTVVPSLELQGIEINIANERLANEAVGDAACRFAVTVYDTKGSMLYTTEQIVGPGEVNRLDLGPRELQGESMFRTSVQVMDTERSGNTRACPALVSQRVYDRIAGKTDYYVPARIR